MTAKARLQADRAELARFVDATFRYADEATAAVLRTFAEGSNEVLASVRVPLNGTGLDRLVEHAAYQATKAANAARPAVFAPPVATFVGTRARERDLANGLFSPSKRTMRRRRTPEPAVPCSDRRPWWLHRAANGRIRRLVWSRISCTSIGAAGSLLVPGPNTPS